MRKSQKSVRVFAAVSGAMCSIPGIAWANNYTGAGAAAGTNNDYVTVDSVSVTNDATNLYFTINLPSTATILLPTESYGLYEIGFQMPGIAGSGNTTVDNYYGQPIGISTGMNYWVGSWTNQTTQTGGPDTGGAELFQYSGSTATRVAGIGTSSPYVPMPVTLTNTSTMITVPLASLGLGNQTTGIGTGGLFNFDVWTTFDSGAQSAYSALDNVASTFTSGTYSDPWNGTAYDSATVPNSTFSTTTYTMVNWNNSGGSGNGTTWDASSSNWSDGGSSPVAYADGDNVLFTDNNNSHYNVTLNSTVSPGSIIVANSAGNYKISGTGSIAGSTWLTMSGSGTLTLANTGTNTFTGATTVNNGTVVIGAKGALPAGNALYINNSVTTNAADTAYTTATGVVQLAPNTGGETLSALTIAPTSTTSITLTSGTTSVTVNGGTLDITNNHLILNYTTDPNTTILGYLSTGSNGGTWNGPGIISSTAAANSNYGVGFADGADGIDTNLTSGEIEVAYVQYGDITLSGLVNANDFHILTTNFGHVVTGGWEDGDFTYTGTVNANDFHLLTGNFGKTESGEDLSMPASDWAALDAFAAANGLSVSSVPEPATASLTAVMCAALLARRRRRARS